VAILYRPARLDELQATQEHIVASINDLTVRHGFGPMASVRPADFQRFVWHDDPSGLWSAEEDGRLVGSAFSWVCGDLWFLAELFIAPDMQGRGIGAELLRRTLDQAARAGATERALITFTFNRVSQALYIRHGLFPGTPIYVFGGSREAVTAGLPPARLAATPITADDAAQLERIDRAVLSVSRAKHHVFLAGDATMRGYLLRGAGGPVGYAYVNANGHIGPLAVAGDDAGDAFLAVLHLAADAGSAQISCLIPGANEAALTVAVAHGLRIGFPLVLMSSRSFGDWSQYLPRNPGFM